MGETGLSDALLTKDYDLIDNFADKYIFWLKNYYYTGGLPAVVDAFRLHKDYQEVRMLQSDILRQYEGDFGKHVDARNLPRIRMVWDAIPMQLIIVPRLSKTNNYWLNNLRNDLKSGGEIRNFIEKYGENKNSKLYQALADTIMRANWQELKEERKMCEALRELFADDLREEFDYILLDCPPTLGYLTINALTAADYVVVPMQCEFYSLEGVQQLMMTIRAVHDKLNPKLNVLGFLLTMYDRRYGVTRTVDDDVRRAFGDQVFKTVVPRNVRMSEAPSFGKPALFYDFNCPGAQAYLRVATEIIQKLEGEQNGN